MKLRRWCIFDAAAGAGCDAEAVHDSPYCELHRRLSAEIGHVFPGISIDDDVEQQLRPHVDDDPTTKL